MPNQESEMPDPLSLKEALKNNRLEDLIAQSETEGVETAERRYLSRTDSDTRSGRFLHSAPCGAPVEMTGWDNGH